jgi:hypothetical protein
MSRLRKEVADWIARAEREWMERGHGRARSSTFEVPYITAMIGAGNSASIAVARRLGMSTLPEDTLDDAPVVVFALDSVK